MKRRFFLFVMICLFAGTTSALASTAYVNGKTASSVHLRTSASQTSESMGLYYTGVEAEVQSSLEEEWVRVSIGAMTGYIMNEYLQMERPNGEMPACRAKQGALNMRAEPSEEAQVLQVLEEAERVIILGQTSSGWYYVLCANSSTGYVMPEDVTLLDEYVSVENASIRRIGETFDGYFIYSWIAPNGQTLYFSGLEEPWIVFEDVNFDGHNDVVITVIHGASNFFSEFYVWNQGEYVHASHNGLAYAICNYQLYPEYGIVHSGANNGSAGALHEDVLFRWEGTDLKIIRRAVSEDYVETIYWEDRNGYTTEHDFDLLSVRVWDYTSHVYEGELVYEEVISLQELNSSEDYQRLFEGEQKALWDGMK